MPSKDISAFGIPYNSNVNSSSSSFLGSRDKSQVKLNSSEVPSNMAYNRGTTLRSFLSDYASNIPNVNLTVNLGRSGGDSSDNPPSNRNRGGSGSKGRLTSTALFASGNRYDQYKERKSATFNWSANIPCGTDYNLRLQGDENFSPLYLMNGEFLPKRVNSQPTYLETLLDNELFYQYLRSVEGKVNRTVSKQFKKKDLYDYLHTLSKALQLYYCVDSVLTYVENKDNHNYGLHSLRDRMTAECLSKFQRLQTVLEKLPCPKNLVLFIRYHYQNFSFDEIGDTTIYRLAYCDIFYDTDFTKPPSNIDGDLFSRSIADLNDFRFQDLISLYLRAFPDDKIYEMPPSTAIVIKCNHFRTFWHNSCIAYKEHHDSKQVSYTQVCKSSDETIRYYSLNPDDIDSSTYSMGSHYLEGIPCPGVFAPHVNFGQTAIEHCTSMTRLYQGRIIGAFTPELGSQAGVCALPILASMGSASTFEVNEYLIPGSRLLCSVDLESQMCATQRFADYLLNPNYKKIESGVQRKLKT